MRSLRWMGVLFLVIAGLLWLGGEIATRAEAEPAEKDLETFVPTETLPADASISFPVDI